MTNKEYIIKHHNVVYVYITTKMIVNIIYTVYIT